MPQIHTLPQNLSNSQTCTQSLKTQFPHVSCIMYELYMPLACPCMLYTSKSPCVIQEWIKTFIIFQPAADHAHFSLNLQALTPNLLQMAYQTCSIAFQSLFWTSPQNQLFTKWQNSSHMPQNAKHLNLKPNTLKSYPNMIHASYVSCPYPQPAPRCSAIQNPFCVISNEPNLHHFNL